MGTGNHVLEGESDKSIYIHGGDKLAIWHFVKLLLALVSNLYSVYTMYSQLTNYCVH